MHKYIFLFLLFLSGCCSTPCDGSIKIHKEIATVSSNVSLLVTRDANSLEETLMIEAANAHAKAFEEDFGQIAPVEVFVLRSVIVPCGKDNTHRYIGCYRVSSNKILVTIGSKYHLPALYHEFIHRMQPDHDVYHKDPRWKGVWADRMKQVNKDLLNKRRRLNSYKTRWGIK